MVLRHAGLLDLVLIAIVKRGRKGAIVLLRDGDQPLRLEVATASVKTGDTTGAGDAFNAGFLAAWVEARHRGLGCGGRATGRHRGKLVCVSAPVHPPGDLRLPEQRLPATVDPRATADRRSAMRTRRPTRDGLPPRDLRLQDAVEPVEHPGHPVDPPVDATDRLDDVELLGYRMYSTSRPSHRSAMKNSPVVGRRAAPVGLRLEHQQRGPDAGDVPEAATVATAARRPPGVVASPMRAARQYSVPAVVVLMPRPGCSRRSGTRLPGTGPWSPRAS